ncbi:TPA: hypothetical protein ACQZHT_001388 [Enterobacter hormaechei]
MKHLSLQQAMLGLRIVQTDHGMIIKSPLALLSTTSKAAVQK